MPYLFELSGEHRQMASAEIMGCAEAENSFISEIESGDGYLLADTDAPAEIFGDRCGLLWRVSQVLFDGDYRQILERIPDAINGLALNGSFAVRARVKNSPIDPVELQRKAGAVISREAGMRVNLTSPDTVFRIFVSGERLFFGLLSASIDRSALEERKVQNRPFFSPISIHPKYARAMINLARAGRGARILDPFCGTGGILIEAGSMGLHPLGSDISQEMIDGSARNLRYEGLSAELKRCDVSAIKDEFGQVDAIVTDPPYGRASTTNREDIRSLYRRMLEAFENVLRPSGYASIVVPDLSLIAGLPEGLAFRESYPLKVHRSLTRNFVLLQRTE